MGSVSGNVSASLPRALIYPIICDVTTWNCLLASNTVLLNFQIPSQDIRKLFVRIENVLWIIYSDNELSWIIYSDNELSTLTMNYLLWQWIMYSDNKLFTLTMNYLLWQWTIYSDNELFTLTMNYLLWQWIIYSDNELSPLTMNYLLWQWITYSDNELSTLTTTTDCNCFSVANEFQDISQSAGCYRRHCIPRDLRSFPNCKYGRRAKRAIKMAVYTDKTGLSLDKYAD